jgi:anti-anti-sigma regulatory factor/HAMP domain-containing protein
MLSSTITPLRIRFGLRLQLMLAMGLLALLLAAVVATALLSLAHIREDLSRAVEVEGQLNRLANDVVIYTHLCRFYEKDIFLHVDDPDARDASLLAWQGAYESLDSAIAAFDRVATAPADRQQVREWRVELDNYRAVFTRVTRAMLDGYITTPQLADGALGPFMGSIQALTDTALSTAQRKGVSAQQAQAALVESTTQSTWVLVLIGLVALIAAVSWCLLFPARLMRPITTLWRAVTQLACGEMTTRVGLTRADELGLLAHGFDEMAGTIQQRTSDLETQRAQAVAARMEAEAAHAQIAEQLETITAQRAVIREMSVPILPLTETTLVMPLVGALDTDRLHLVQEQALRAIEQKSARFLILDITGVPIVDTQVAQGLMQVVLAGRLLGAEVLLVGIRPEVAQAVVGLGIQLGTIISRSTLQSGVAYVLGRA